MGETSEPAKTSTPVYAVYSSASPRVIYANSVKEVRAHLSTPELRNSDGRFKTFQNVEECETYFSKNPVSKILTPSKKEMMNDGYRSPYPKLRPQELSKFLKLIQNQKNDEAVEFMNQNPHYFIDMSIDQPSILHTGCRHNALHLCARYGNLFIAMEILKRIRDVKYIADIYNTTANIEETSAILTDRFLNNPDKIARRTPLIMAARQGYDKLVMFLSSFPELQLPDKDQLKDAQCQFHDWEEDHGPKCFRILDCLLHPSKTYCITLYKEVNDEEMPFFAITSRFPHPMILGNEKQSYFKTLPASTFTGRAEDGITSIRVSKSLDGKFLSCEHAVNESINAASHFVPYASLGVFGEKWIATTFYQRWAAEFKKMQRDPVSSRNYLSNVAARLADSNGYYLYYSNMSGMVIPEAKYNKFMNKLQLPDDDEDAELALLKAFENLTVSNTQSKNIFKFVEIEDTNNDDDNEAFCTAPSTPQ